jgi:hypothetical protein
MTSHIHPVNEDQLADLLQKMLAKNEETRRKAILKETEGLISQ